MEYKSKEKYNSPKGQKNELHSIAWHNPFLKQEKNPSFH